MRPFFVEFRSETVKPTLLSRHVSGWRSSRLRFESSVHALMPTILLRFAWLYEFGNDAETYPPSGKSRETSKRVGSKGNTVIRANSSRETKFLEETSEDLFCAGNSGGMQSLAAEKVASEVVCDGEWEAIYSIPSLELSFEISAPDIIGSHDGTVWFAGMANATAIFASRQQSIAVQDITDSRTTRELPVWFTLLKIREEFLCTPSGVMVTKIEKSRHDFRVGRIGRVLRFPRKILETSRTIFHISINPFIAGLTRDAIKITDLSKGKRMAKKISDEFCFFVHG